MMTDTETVGSVLALSCVVIPAFIAWGLSGRDARRNLISMDLFLAGAAGCILGFLAVFVPAFLYNLGTAYNILPEPRFDPNANHPGLAILVLFAVAALSVAWLGYIAGLTYVLLKLGRRRAAGAFLLGPSVVYIIGTGACAILSRFGMRGVDDFADPSPIGFIPLLLVPVGLWLLCSTRGKTAPR
jgi:hypothetical protein